MDYFFLAFSWVLIAKLTLVIFNIHVVASLSHNDMSKLQNH